MRSVWLPLLALLLTLLISETTSVDLWLQDHFFDFQTQSWLIWKENYWLQLIFYSGAKKVIVAVGCGLLILWLLSWKKSALIPHRRPIGLLLLALIFVPATIAGLKNLTNIHCPWSIHRYGGSVPYIKLFEPYPTEFKSERPGKCFPAGHPSGGFAFLMLFYLFSSRSAQWLGLSFGLSLGWIMGIYQMLKGAHYFSHVVISMLLAWIIVTVIYKLLTQFILQKLKI